MLVSQERKHLYYYLISLSALFSLVQMATMEYFLGLELFRPIILWTYHSYRENQTNKLSLLKKTFLSSWPFMAILGAYAVWRVFFLELAGEDPNNPVLLQQFLSSPYQASIDLLQKIIQDVIYF